MDQDDLTRAFDAEYEQMLSDMFDWPWPDAEPPDYIPIEIPPEEVKVEIPKRSHNLMIATHGFNNPDGTKGRKLITDMDDRHLQNTIAYFKRTGYPNNQHSLQLMLEEQNIRRLEAQDESLFGRSQR